MTKQAQTNEVRSGLGIARHIRANIFQLLFIFAVPFLLYYQTMDYEYVLDDKIVLSENTFVKKGIKGIPDILLNGTFDGYEYYNVSQNPLSGSRYRPLSLVMFAIEYELFASHDAGSTNLVNEDRLRKVNHFFNIFFYSLIGLSLFLIVSLIMHNEKKLVWKLGVPFFTALIFVLHPVHIEVVANIKSRDELMMLFFSLVTMIYALKYFNAPSKKHAIVLGILFFLAILSKENAITLLAIVPMIAYFFRNKTIKNSLKAGLPIFISAAVYFLFRFNVVGDIGSSEDSYLSNSILNNPFSGVSGSKKNATIFYTLGKYLQLLIYPHPLTHDYYPKQIPIIGWGDLRAVFSLLIYLGLLVYAFLKFKKRSVLSFCIFFFVGTLFITSNFVVSIGTFMNERFLFMPSLAFCLALAYLLIEKAQNIFASNLYKYTTLLFFVLLSLGFTYKNMDRIPDWRNALTLDKSAVMYSPNSIRANQFYAYELYLSGMEEKDRSTKKAMFEEAYTHVNKALSMYPDYSQALICKAGLATEFYKLDGDLSKLLVEFYYIQLSRNTPFVDQYLRYLEPRVDKTLLNKYYSQTGNALIQKGEKAKGEEYINKAITFE